MGKEPTLILEEDKLQGFGSITRSQRIDKGEVLF